MTFSLNDDDLTLFRLRNNQQIVGYQRYVSSKKPYYSKDRLWWQAQEIKYNIKDSYAKFKDLNQEWIFENDIIELKVENELKKAVVLYSSADQDYIAIETVTLKTIKRKKWVKNKMKKISYLFINNELIKYFKENNILNNE